MNCKGTLRGEDMHKKIIIGTGLDPFHSPACYSVCLWKWANISENKMFYILNSDYAEVYIHKDSPEARELEEWLSIEKNRNNESVGKKVLEFLLPRMSVDEFTLLLNIEKNLSYGEGYKQAQHDIREALGLRMEV